MSRVEKQQIKKSKMRKFRFLTKVVFMLFMTLNLLVCIYVVDSSAKNLLGEKQPYDKVDFKEIQSKINDNIENINGYIVNIIQQINK
ncbi:MAG: hypothetical protein ACRDA3_12285 [Peptostreptococcaceae bacterium]